MNCKVLSAALALCLATGQTLAYDFVSGGIAYNVLSNTNTRRTAAVTYVTTNPDATGYVSTYKGSVVIPMQTMYGMQTFNVTQIGDLAMFNNQGLYTLRLPETITTIGGQAFSHCYSLYQVNIPENVVRIADYAFEYCEDLTEISLPAALTDMGDGVFQQCYGMQKFEVDPACPYFKSVDGALYSQANDPDGMTLKAFPGARPEATYIMPDNVAVIDEYALSANTTLTELTLSKDLREIEMLAFSECAALQAVNVPEANTSYASDNGVLYNKAKTTLLYYPVARPDVAYEVPEGVTALDALSFYLLRGLNALSLPSTLKQIGELAFYGTRSFTEITCSALTPPTWQASAMAPGAGLFDQSVYTQATLYVPAEAIDAYKKASGWKNFANIRAIGSSGVEIPVVDADATTKAEYYDINGRRLAEPAPGLNIIRRGAKTAKQLLK